MYFFLRILYSESVFLKQFYTRRGSMDPAYIPLGAVVAIFILIVLMTYGIIDPMPEDDGENKTIDENSDNNTC
jgi:hypothetical protein